MQPLAEVATASGGTVLVPMRPMPREESRQSQIEGALINFTRAYAQDSNVYQLETDQDGQDKPLPLRVEVDRRKVGGGKVPWLRRCSRPAAQAQ